jgi:hypothetical protein
VTGLSRPLSRPLGRIGQRIGQHWLFAVVLTAGFALRVLAQVAYRPALMYIDTEKYLYKGYPGADPVGYKAPLALILLVGNLSVVTAIQHVLGLAMAIAVYVILVRLGCRPWLAALGAAPVALDAYQLQIEQTIMPDVWFEALIVAAIAVLLIRPSPARAAAVSAAGDGKSGRELRSIVIAGLLLGLSATVRQVGEILIFPGLLYLIAIGGGWRQVITRSAAMVAAFALPVVSYMAGSYFISGHFWLDSGSLSISSYGRMATVANCATLRIPSYERPLCPTARQRAFGIDWLDHDARSPIKAYVPPAGLNRYAVIARFDHQVAEQQPVAVATAIVKDAVKLFAIDRTSSQGGTPISRWQFQDSYPTYPAWVTLNRQGVIVFGLRLTPAGGPLVRHPLEPKYGGKAEVDRPVAAFLRGYQLNGGYTPGPAMAVLTLAGLAGSALLLRRRLSDRPRRLALGCVLFFGCGVAVLAISDAFQFSWRYQLPALVTLPPAGVLGISAGLAYLVHRRQQRAGRPRASADELAPVGSSDG